MTFIPSFSLNQPSHCFGKEGSGKRKSMCESKIVIHGLIRNLNKVMRDPRFRKDDREV